MVRWLLAGVRGGAGRRRRPVIKEEQNASEAARAESVWGVSPVKSRDRTTGTPLARSLRKNKNLKEDRSSFYGQPPAEARER
jgi:hypothetical protein